MEQYLVRVLNQRFNLKSEDFQIQNGRRYRFNIRNKFGSSTDHVVLKQHNHGALISNHRCYKISYGISII